MDLSRFGPPMSPLAAALANAPQAPMGAYDRSGVYASSPGMGANATAPGMMPSIAGLPPGMMPMPSTSPTPAMGPTGVPQIPRAIPPVPSTAPRQGVPSPGMPAMPTTRPTMPAMPAGLTMPTGPAIPPPLAPMPQSAIQNQ